MKRKGVADAQRRLRDFADPKKVLIVQRFFKTGKGEYGEGDRFIGVMVPETRKVAREFLHLTLEEIESLLNSPVHEERLLALVILSHQFKKGDETSRKLIYRLYCRNFPSINNWDLVDLSAPGIVGAYLESRDRKVIYRWAKSRHLWTRRIAILSTFWWIRQGDLLDTFRLAKILKDDSEDLMHKAVGWMLREAGKRNKAELKKFLDQYAASLPRTLLRYSLEKLSPSERKKYMRKAYLT